MTKVSIKNFQSIAGADFHIDGFTVIVGKNNVGKSAVMRAIKAALSNQAGTEYIRNGTKQTEVDLFFPSGRFGRYNVAKGEKETGLDIQWRKSQDKTSYKVNGEPFSALNRAVPKPILDAGFLTMEVGDQKINPLIADQHKEIFLLDKPGSMVTEVMATIYDLNTLSKADDLCQKELKSQKSLLKTRESDLGGVKEGLSKYAGFDAVKATVDILSTLEARSEALSTEEIMLADMARDLAGASAAVKALRPASSVRVPDANICGKVLGEASWIESAAEGVSEAVRTIKELRKAGSVPIPDPSTAEDLAGECAWLASAESESTDAARSVKALSKATGTSVPEVDDRIASKVEWLVEAEKALSALVTSVERLNGAGLIDDKGIETLLFSASSALEEAGSIGKDTEEFMDAAKSAKESRDELKDISAEMVGVEKELEGFDVCPACGRAIK